METITERLRSKLLIEYKNFKRKRSFLTESTINGKTIVNVDIQPEYENGITFNVNDWVSFLNQNTENNQILFLYNGADTLGMISESDYKEWLFNLGVDEDVIMSSNFYDKGYAFFRYCMDEGIDDDSIVDLIKYMIRHDINDSRDLNEEMWNNFMEETNNTREDVRSLLETADDMINIPDLMEYISRFRNIVLTGGGINECLKEVELSLMALEKPYSILNQFTY